MSGVIALYRLRIRVHARACRVRAIIGRRGVSVKTINVVVMAISIRRRCPRPGASETNMDLAACENHASAPSDIDFRHVGHGAMTVGG